MAQPGLGDEKETEGKVDQNARKFGDYRCVFREANGSLYMMMKHVKSKRTFTNTFSKSKLVEMGLKQSVEKVTNLLRDSKAAMSADTKQDLSFLIGFGDAENDKSVQFNQLSKEYAYSKGCALYVLVSIENSYYSAEYTFKLLEQERNEVDIVRDIIADMQEEIDELKAKVNSEKGVASWYTTCGQGVAGDLPMSGAYLEPTLPGMVALSQDTKSIIIGMPGLYKIGMEVNFTSCTGAGHHLIMNVNGTQVIRNPGSNYGGWGSMYRFIQLKKDDKITFNTNHTYATQKDYNCFTVEKI